MHWLRLAVLWCLVQSIASAQETPPWQSYFAEQTGEIAVASAARLAAVNSGNWPAIQTAWRSELQEMLGLAPWPERTDLQVTITGRTELTGVTVDRLHYQSRPGLYVAANLYQPIGAAPADGWPAVVYVCGHARVTDHGKLLGNKTSYQHHGLWLARHGAVCLAIDTVQLGEFHGEHHGTYKLGRWDWISRGYTPAGVEAWNAIRAVDLLSELPNVNAARIGITGRSGGGAYSWFAAALDERLRVAVPVAGITDLQNHVVDGCVDGHCDCMYFVNYFGWDYGQLAALVAPRALLLANSDNDGIFPLDGVMRVHRQIDSLYKQLHASNQLGLLITPGPHKDTQELQVGAFKWLLQHLLDDPLPLIDSPALKELEPHTLAVFPAETPSDERVTAVAGWFVPAAASVIDGPQAAAEWEQTWRPELLRLRSLPERTQANFVTEGLGRFKSWNWELLRATRDLSENAAKNPTADLTTDSTAHSTRNSTDSVAEPPGISILRIEGENTQPPIVHLIAASPEALAAESVGDALQQPEVSEWLALFPRRTHYFVAWRGADWMSSTSTPQQQHMLVRRFYLLGQTPEQVMLGDLLTAAHWIRQHRPGGLDLAGVGRHAALMELAGLLAVDDPARPAETRFVKTVHVANRTTDPLLNPALAGILRVCDYESLHAAAAHLMDVSELTLASSSSPLLVDTASRPQQATGMRIVEVEQTRAKVWVRATRWQLPNLGDLPEVRFLRPAVKGKANRDPILPESGVEGLRFAVPGVAAEVRVGVKSPLGLSSSGGAKFSYQAWQSVDATTDFSAVVEFAELTPGTRYQVRTEVRATSDENAVVSALVGSFTTLPAADAVTPFRLAVGTCQEFNDRDGPHGFDAYRTLLHRKTNAFVMAGDVVYYDALARSTELAHYHWQRTYALPTLLEFHRQVPTYFLKDDHDTYVDDTWPGQQHDWTGEFTFADGQRIFRQQTGLPAPAYRTFPIGSDLQIWLMEGRDYRSPNDAPDGADKSIWGEEQKQWLRETLAASKARFRVVISPTPLVGPDRDSKSDNHANASFSAEGAEVRKLLAQYPNTVSVCGDRHWQYHSIDPETGLHEFSVGPLSNRHAGGWKPDDFRAEVHQFLRVSGGYLELDLTGADESRRLTLRHVDTLGQEQHRHTLQ